MIFPGILQDDVAAFSSFTKADATGGKPKAAPKDSTKEAPKKDAAPSPPPSDAAQQEAQPKQTPSKPQPAPSRPSGQLMVLHPDASSCLWLSQQLLAR